MAVNKKAKADLLWTRFMRVLEPHVGEDAEHIGDVLRQAVRAEIDVAPEPSRPVFLDQALNEGDGTYHP